MTSDTEPMLMPHVVLQEARELHRFYVEKTDKPYTCNVLSDCIATIENLQSRLATPPATRSPADTEGARLANWLADYSDDCVEDGDNLDAEQISKAAQWIADHLTPTAERVDAQGATPTNCAWPNCDQPSGHDYCHKYCLDDAGRPTASGGDAQVAGMIDTDDEEQVERSNSRIDELLREREALVKALRELVDYDGTLTGRRP